MRFFVSSKQVTMWVALISGLLLRIFLTDFKSPSLAASKILFLILSLDVSSAFSEQHANIHHSCGVSEVYSCILFWGFWNESGKYKMERAPMFDQMWKCCQENDIKSLRELILQGNDVNLRDVFSLDDF
jgi:hypothetical protein